jgi:dystrophin
MNIGSSISAESDVGRQIRNKAFTRWINAHLSAEDELTLGADSCLVRDLYIDLRDGACLISLVEWLSGRTINLTSTLVSDPTQNVSRLLLILEEECQCRLDNLSAAAIAEGDPNAIMEVLWFIILHWHIKIHLGCRTFASDVNDCETILIRFCRERTHGYEKVTIENLTTSWTSGLAFNALLHSFHPEWFIFPDLLQNEHRLNIEHAFHLARDRLHVTQLLDIDDVCCGRLDRLSVMLYITDILAALQQHGSSQQFVRNIRRVVHMTNYIF